MSVRATIAVLQVLIVLGLVGLWWLNGPLDLVRPSVLPPILDVAKEFAALPFRADFQAALGNTVYDALRGLFLATILAVPLGILIGMFPPLEISTRLIVDFGRSFPVIALLPILVLLFGATPTMKVVSIAIACFFPVLLQTIYGARRLDPTISDTVRSFRIPVHLRFFRVLLPAAGPYIATGIRIASTVAILVAVGVEIVSNVYGIGREISTSRNFNETDTAFAYIIYAGLLGVALTLIWDFIEQHLLRWHLRSQSA